MNRAGPVLAVLLCLAGAFVVLVAAGRSWALVDLAGSGLLPARSVGVDGAQLAPGLPALGLVALAGVVAVPATRRWGRVAVGLVLLAAGVGILALVAGQLTDLAGAVQDSRTVRETGQAAAGIRRTLWPYACALGGLTVAAAGLLVAARGRSWSALGRRYDAPTAAPPPVGERDLWAALDRGEDPTGGQDPPDSGHQGRG